MALWLERTLITGPHLALVFDEDEFMKAMADMNVPPRARPLWSVNGGGATTYILENSRGYTACVVALGDQEGSTGIDVAALLCHEAVHIFQAFCEEIGERNPSHEFEAYSIQQIAQTLMEAYAARIEEK